MTKTEIGPLELIRMNPIIFLTLVRSYGQRHQIWRNVVDQQSQRQLDSPGKTRTPDLRQCTPIIQGLS